MLIYVVALIAAVVVYYKFVKSPPPEDEILSRLRTDNHWTIGEEENDESIRPFEVKFSQSDLEDLHRRIDSTRYPTPALEDSKFHYGVNQNFMKEFVKYWRNSYSWSDQEKELNKFDHFKTKVEGLDIHFVHVKPKNLSKNIVPKQILLCHGWPGSFHEFYKMIPMLTDPTSHGGNETDVFEVIAPSIPGYGFSQPPEVQGFTEVDCSRIFHKLMLRLGHERYYAQGGDWGSGVCKMMAITYPDRILGLHLNFAVSKFTPLVTARLLLGSFAPKLFFRPQVANYLFPLKKMVRQLVRETGYFHIHATKPDTLGFALTDSPVGLAAYIIEKFSSWTDMSGRDKEDGDLWKHWTKDEILNNVMIYWISGNITSTMRLYKEAFAKNDESLRLKVHVPTGYAWFPNEIVPVVKGMVEAQCTNLISYTYMKDGGHFAAMQVPQLLAEDIWQFVGKVEMMKPRDSTEQDFKQTHLDRLNTQ